MSTPEPVFSPAARPPHPAHRLAVFIDIENFAGYCADMGVPVDIATVLEQLGQHHGRIQIKRSFGDVSSLPAPTFNPYRIRRMLQAHQIDHLDIPHRPTSYSKNSADIRLVVEAVALIHQRPEITHIVVVSNDRDFIPLFNHAREHGKLVIGCGPRRANVNEDYRNACDVFLFHEELISLPGSAAAPTQPVVSIQVLTAVPDTLGQPAGQEPTPAQPEALMASVAEPKQPSTENAAEESEPHPVALMSDQAWQPGSYFAAPPVPELADAPLTAPLPSRAATEGGMLSKAAGQDEPIDCLLAALRTIQAEGGMPMASRVAARMKELFPHFDVKKVFGSFKQFCIEQEKSGLIELSNRDQANFTLAIPPQQHRPQHQPVAHPNGNVEAERHLLAKYREWSFQKLKIPFPSPAVRARFYDILVQVLDDRPLRMDSLPLQELSRLCSIPLAEVTANPTDVAFRLCYGLYRGKAFRFYRTDSTFNPDIIGLAVEPHALEDCIVNNTRASFIYDSQNHGLPLDEATLARLMQGSAAVVPDPLPPAETPAAPAPAPASTWEPTPEPVPLPVREVAPVLPMPTVTATEPEPAPAPEPVPELDQLAAEPLAESDPITSPIPQAIAHLSTQSPDQPVEPPADQLARPEQGDTPPAEPIVVDVVAEIATAPETAPPQPAAKPSLTRKPRTTRSASSTKAIKASAAPQDQSGPSDQSGQRVQADPPPANLLSGQAVVPDTGLLPLSAPEPDKASKPKRSTARKKVAPSTSPTLPTLPTPPTPPEDSLWS